MMLPQFLQAIASAMSIPFKFKPTFKRSRSVVPAPAFEPKPMRRSSGTQGRGRRRVRKPSLKAVFHVPRLITGGFSGNSHQRRIQRRRCARAERLAAA